MLMPKTQHVSHHRLQLRKQLRWQLPLPWLFWVGMSMVLPVAGACSIPASFTADQAGRDKRYVALTGSTIQLTCGSDMVSAEACPRCIDGIKQIKQYTLSRTLVSVSTMQTPDTLVVSNNSHTAVIFANASRSLTGYYSCYCAPMQYLPDRCTVDETNGTPQQCLLGTLNLVVTDDGPSMASPLCCAMVDGSLNCNFYQNYASTLHDMAAVWNVSYAFSARTGRWTGSVVAACTAAACSVQLQPSMSLRFVNYSFVVSSKSLLGENSYMTYVYTDDALERLPPVYGLRATAVSSKVILLQWQAYEERYHVQYYGKLTKYCFSYKVRYWQTDHVQELQELLLSSSNMSLSVTVPGLVPATWYSFEVWSRLKLSKLDCTWSIPRATPVSIRTLDLPTLAPATVAYTIRASEQPGSRYRNVTVFWKASQDAMKHPDGHVDQYVIAWSYGNVTISGTRRSVVLYLRVDVTYNVSVEALQAISGLTSAFSKRTVVIPAQPEDRNLLACRPSAEALNTTAVKIRWLIPRDRDISYIIWWCLLASEEECKGDIESYPVDGSPAIVALPENNASVMLHRFGVSAKETANSAAGGIVWAPCTHGSISGGSKPAEFMLSAPVVVAAMSTDAEINDLPANQVRIRYACRNGEVPATELRLHHCPGVSDVCQDEANVVPMDACTAETSFDIDSGRVHRFWISGRLGNVSVNSTAVVYSAPHAHLTQMYYWMVPVIVLLTVGSTGLIVVLYRLQQSVKSVQRIVHIPPTSAAAAAEDQPETESFLGESWSNMQPDFVGVEEADASAGDQCQDRAAELLADSSSMTYTPQFVVECVADADKGFMRQMCDSALNEEYVHYSKAAACSSRCPSGQQIMPPPSPPDSLDYVAVNDGLRLSNA